MGQKLTVGGVLCPEVRKHDIRIGYDILDVQTNRSVMFGRLALKADFSGEPVSDYIISYTGLEFAKLSIQKALESRCDVVFIDEVGHLELAGKGIIESVKTVYQEASNSTTVVRRPLLTAFLEYFNRASPTIRFIIKDLELDTSYPLTKRL